MRVIDTVTLVPSQYGETDIWNSRDEFSGKDAPGRWIELRMRSRYTRSEHRFSIFYTGPQGESRVVHQGPQVPGPHGSLIPQSTVISAHPMAHAETIEVQEGDVIICNGLRMVIADDDPQDYPDLVTEAEWGLIVARRAVREEINEVRASSPATDQDAVELVNRLYRVDRRMRDMADELRARHRVTGNGSGHGTEEVTKDANETVEESTS